MPQVSDIEAPVNIYEEDLNETTTWNLASQGLESVPKIKTEHLRVIYLQNNNITSLPDDFFPTLPRLTWLDLRDNSITNIPASIQDHQSLTHLLLKNNKLSSLPNELGTVVNLTVLQLSGNPLVYPSKEVINGGVSKILNFLREKYFENLFASRLDVSESTSNCDGFPDTICSDDMRSYNSVLDEVKIKKNKTLTIQLSGKDLEGSEDEQFYSKIKGKCPKLAKSRKKAVPTYCQSSKYLKPLQADSARTQNEKIKQNYLKDLATKKHQNLLVTREKILQDRKNIELLKNWRKNYRKCLITSSQGMFKMEPKDFPYDTNPEYMTLLSREDIEKDLPDKYKKKIMRRSKLTVPRKNNNDVHLAMKIKQLFEKLEAIDLNKSEMTPRTEQKLLYNEIQKISEIKEKLMELSAANRKSVIDIVD